MTQFYAGVGSRSTPPDICTLMTDIAAKLSDLGWILRSGHADGADLAFERGALTNAEIYLPSAHFNSKYQVLSQIYLSPTSEALALAARFHPAWTRCSEFARLAHARNMHQILGYELDSPVRFVICWTSDGQDSGGTGQALRLARSRMIPVFNLYDLEARQRLERFCARGGPGLAV